MGSSSDIVTALEHATIPGIIGTGLLLGIIHVLTGPDHLSALIVLSAGSSWRSCQLGMRWGCGHSTGLIVVTAFFLSLNQQWDVDAFGNYCDFLVGFLMMGLGAWSFRHYWLLRRQVQVRKTHKLQEKKKAEETTPLRVEEAVVEVDNDADSTEEIQKLLHSHHVEEHMNTWCFGLCNAPSPDIKNPRTQQLTAFAYGTMHGLAGTGGILGVLPAVVLNDWSKSSAYLLSFCVASIFIMGVFAATYGEVTGRMSKFSDTSLYRIGIFSSCVSLVVGITWVILVSTGKLDEVFG